MHNVYQAANEDDGATSHRLRRSCSSVTDVRLVHAAALFIGVTSTQTSTRQIFRIGTVRYAEGL